MKVKTIPSSWLNANGHRLDCNPFMGGAVEVRVALSKLENQSAVLGDLTSDRFGGIYHAGRYKRIWVASAQSGKPFLSSRDVLQSDLSKLNFIATKSVTENPKLLVHKDQILITRSGTVGRMSYVNDFMDGMSCTEHVMRVDIDESKIGAGFIYAFLNSSFGMPMVLEGVYGAMIQHIEPEHLTGMLVPRLSKSVEHEIDSLIKKSSQLRADFQKNIDAATELLFSSAGLSDITPAEWHSEGPDIGDQIYLKSPRSIRALNFGGRFKRLIENLKSVPHKTLGEICQGGQLSSGARFKRIDADQEHGVQLIGQKQGFWFKPEGRSISAAHSPQGIFAKDETVMIASQGTLGEREVFCRPIFITGKWLDFVYTQHFLRVSSADPEVSGAYLYAFLRSETAFRCLRSMSIGSKQQDIHVGMLSELPIPLIKQDDKRAVEQLIRDAFKAKDLADEYENTAIAMVESGIKAAAKKN